jgi:hypothetical protein
MDGQTSRETDHSINNFLEVVNKAGMVGKKNKQIKTNDEKKLTIFSK